MIRPGAPYDLDPLTAVGAPPEQFRNEIEGRCGSPKGSKDCLIPRESVTYSATSDQDCFTESFSYDPPEKNGKLQRGTTVTAHIVCPARAPDSGDGQDQSGNHGSSTPKSSTKKSEDKDPDS